MACCQWQKCIYCVNWVLALYSWKLLECIHMVSICAYMDIIIVSFILIFSSSPSQPRVLMFPSSTPTFFSFSHPLPPSVSLPSQRLIPLEPSIYSPLSCPKLPHFSTLLTRTCASFSHLQPFLFSIMRVITAAFSVSSDIGSIPQIIVIHFKGGAN